MRQSSGADTRSVDIDDRFRLGPFESFGQRFMVKTSDIELAGFLAKLYEPLRSPGAARPAVEYCLIPPSGNASGVLTRNQEVICTSSRRHPLLGSLVSAINRHVIEGPSHTRLMFHAAAADLNGAGVLLPAPMESGKTTLVTGLLDRGLSYLSDEAVTVAHDLTMEGYPKPLSVDPGSWEVLAHHEPEESPPIRQFMSDQWQLPVQSFASIVCRSRLRLIVFPRHQAGAEFKFETLTPGMAVKEAFASLFVPAGNLASVDKVRGIGRLAELIPASRLIYSDLDNACGRIIAELERLENPSEVSDNGP